MKVFKYLSICLLSLILVAQVTTSEAAVTVENRVRTVFGNKNILICDVNFDNSYAAGGETFDLSKYGMSTADGVFITPSDNGYIFDFDYTNEKIRVKANAPPIVYDEEHSATAANNLVTLDYPAAWIINVAGVTKNQGWVRTSSTTSRIAYEFCLATAITDDTRTTLYVNPTTGSSVYVTYITQAWQDVYELLVQEEAVTTAAGSTALDNAIMGFGYLSSAVTGRYTPIDAADTAVTGEVNVTFGSATSGISVATGDLGVSCLVTYLKRPSAGWLLNRFVPDEDSTLTAGSGVSLHAFDKPMLAWMLTGVVTRTGRSSLGLVRQHQSLTNGDAQFNWGYTGPATTGSTPAAMQVAASKTAVSGGTITAAAYLWGYPWEIPNLRPLPVPNGSDLSGTTVKLIVIGR